MRWTRMARETNVAYADGEVVWSWRSEAGAKVAGSVPRTTVATKHGHRGERDIRRNPSRRECRLIRPNLW
jgi:hypothetical protein